MLAKANRRSKSFCAVEAIKVYVEKESWQTKAIAEGLEDAGNGRLIEHEKVKKWVQSWDTPHEDGLPQCE